MRALNVPAAGSSPVLSELPTPEAGPGTVLVRVKAAALNAIDNGIAAGMMAQMMPHEYPLVLGRDAAGVVEAVGEGVDHVAVGDEVIGHQLLVPPIQSGTLAEYAVLPAASVIVKPANLDFTSAAALPLASAAAVGAITAIDAQPGQTVLLVGASGGVGSYAIQLLKAGGVTVIATGTADDTERLTGLGAHTVIDYTAAPVVDQVRALFPDGVDGLIDVVAYGPDGLPIDAVRKGGKVASTLGAANDEVLAAAGLTGTNVMASPVREVVGPVAEKAAAGSLRIDVEQILPFEQAADGLATLAGGQARGKIVIRIQD